MRKKGYVNLDDQVRAMLRRDLEEQRRQSGLGLDEQGNGEEVYEEEITALEMLRAFRIALRQVRMFET